METDSSISRYGTVQPAGGVDTRGDSERRSGNDVEVSLYGLRDATFNRSATFRRARSFPAGPMRARRREIEKGPGPSPAQAEVSVVVLGENEDIVGREFAPGPSPRAARPSQERLIEAV